ncbi:long-chain acyl-CoA synthetase [Variovorax ginsengisoli]|uniref:Long-chain acyl-CoA synthetase n=1 Tax=Variovorax ginsengisoli TaxID=363844 RepID=A0ABT9S9E2_9BURK|nr:long-chain acyl-CoA synthetase [Variovorax ginsengisoli]
MTVSLTQCLHRAVQQNPERIATVFGERRQSYRQLHARVARLAGTLRALGVRKGDRVGILSLNSDRYLEVYLAVFWLGAAINPANTRWSAAELAYSFNDCGTTLLLIDDAHLPLMDAIRADSDTLRHVIYLGDGICPAAMHDYEALVAGAQPVEDLRASGSDLASVFYTGGTTGFPKGVMLSHESLMGAVLNRLALGYPVGPVYLHAAPIFHLAGAMGVLWQFMAGGTHVLIPSFSAAAFMQAVARERVTDTLLVPTMIQMVLDHPDFRRDELASLRFLVYGASPITETLLDRTTAAFPDLTLMQGYGMTELAGCVSYLPPRYHTAEGRRLGKLRSAGRAAAMAEIKIVGDDGIELPRGQVGEIAARGMSAMLGYWNKPDETAKTLRDGWVHSGDGAYMDEEGFIFIVDRIKDMIVSGGENVYSAEVENAILKHPAVASCAVIGIPSAKWGESVHAVVVPKPGMAVVEAELIAHCKTLIASYKCPRSVESRAELPLSGAGKILKNKLREPHWENQGRRVA